MPEPDWSYSNRWLTTFTINAAHSSATPQDLIAALAAENIEARPVWKPMHLQPVFENAPYYPHEEGKDIAHDLFESGICVPSGSNLTDEEQARVISVLQRVLNHAQK